MKASDVIKMRRKEMGLTMKEVASAVGVSEGTVSRWESGDIKNMRRDKIAALARVLDVPPAVLMDWEEYDVELAKRKQMAKELYDLAGVSEIGNIEIALDLLKKLEQKQ